MADDNKTPEKKEKKPSGNPAYEGTGHELDPIRDRVDTDPRRTGEAYEASKGKKSKKD